MWPEEIVKRHIDSRRCYYCGAYCKVLMGGRRCTRCNVMWSGGNLYVMHQERWQKVQDDILIVGGEVKA